MIDSAGAPQAGGAPVPPPKAPPTDPPPKRQAKRIFLQEYARTLCVRKACRAIRRSPTIVYKWRDRDARFRAAWDRIKTNFPRLLEETARSLALNGIIEPVFQGGKKCGTRRKVFPKLVMELLRAEDPQKYARAPLPPDENPTDVDARAAAIRERLRTMDDSIPSTPPETPPAAPPAEPSSPA